jgi:peptidoglycan/xylan/chitin deacetylase (PgdA/CDA1 family)
VLGNHTWDHSHLLVQSPAQVRAELRRTDAALERVAGVRTRLMRPPFGARDFHSLAEIHRDGYVPIMWSVPLPKDWEQPGDATIARRVIDGVTPGAIVVLHDGNRGIICGRSKHEAPARVCNRSQEIAATREIIEGLRARGYRFVTIPQLLIANRIASAKIMRTADRGVR